MYARVTQFELEPGRTDEVRRLLDDVKSRWAKIDGFRGSTYLQAPSSGKAVVVTFWESEAALTSAEGELNRIRDESMSTLKPTAQPVSERYDVILHDIST